MREDESEIGGEHREARSTQQSTGTTRPDQDCIAIERNAAHDQAGARVPGVVLPKREESPWPQRIVNLLHGGWPLGRRDVVKGAISEREIDIAGGHKLGAALEARRVRPPL